MNATHISTHRALSRRTFLRGVGVTLALPLLEAMRPSFAWARVAATPAAPQRMLAIMTNMGILPQFFFPKDDGGTSPYLDLLRAHREKMTVFSGVSHPEVDGGHHADLSFLTAAPHPGRTGFRNTISLDQFAAERIGHLTRFASLPLVVAPDGKRSLSWNRAGVAVPGERQPSEVFKRLFVQGTEREVAAQLGQLRLGRSILDAVSDRARGLARELGSGDRDKLDEYFTSVRETEQRLHRAEEWEQTPKPIVAEPAPKDIDDHADLVGKTRLIYDMARHALATDSTRLITVFIAQDHNPTVKVEGVSHGHHSLTHHGNKDENVSELRLIEEAQFRDLDRLLATLAVTQEDGAPLLDRTSVLFGTNMGSANAHSNTNLPVLLAGGGFRHAGQLKFDEKNNYPLANLYVSMLQRLGIEAGSFASSTGTMRGLEV